MYIFSSIRIKTLSLLAAGFIITAISVVLVAQIQLKTIVDSNQNTIYEEKTATIIRSIEENYKRLHKTGQVEAYEEGFKASLINKMRKTYYGGNDLQVYPFIIDTRGASVMHPAFLQGDKTLSKQVFIQKMLSIKNGSFDYVYEGKKKWCFIKEYKDWDWIVGYALPHEIKYADIRTLRNMLIAVILSIKTVVLLVLFVLIIRLLRPIVDLTAASKAMAQGDLDHEVKIKSNDELGVLAISFIKMRDSINKQFIALNKEISERKQAEEMVQKQLSEKTIILKEVHHRMKNNISFIEGLLSIPMQSVSNPEAVSTLQDAITRVQGMRILYDKLLISKDYQEVSIKEYTETLIDAIIVVFPDSEKIHIEKQIADFNLNSKVVIPLGIIINELFTNVIKYSFQGRTEGLIYITIDKTENHINLTIQDNGIGLDPDFDLNNTTGLGLTIVKMLTEQLGGNFTIENHNGTKSILKFDI